MVRMALCISAFFAGTVAFAGNASNNKSIFEDSRPTRKELSSQLTGAITSVAFVDIDRLQEPKDSPETFDEFMKAQQKAELDAKSAQAETEGSQAHIVSSVGDFGWAAALTAIALTWGVGLLPPILVRYVFLGRPLKKWPAFATVVLFWFVGSMIWFALGHTQNRLFTLFAAASFLILRIGVKKPLQSRHDNTTVDSSHPLDSLPKQSCLAPEKTSVTDKPPTKTDKSPTAVTIQSHPTIGSVPLVQAAVENLWAQALTELDTGTFKPGLWAKAFSEADGDEAKAKAKYLQFRVAALQHEIQVQQSS